MEIRWYYAAIVARGNVQSIMRFLRFLSVVLYLLLANGLFACTCVYPDGRNMREVAEQFANGPHASKVIFEGHVDSQEVLRGFAGAPENAMSMTPNGEYRLVSMTVMVGHRGVAPGA